MALDSNNISCDTLREWAPLTDLFSKLPSKSQVGLFSQEVKLTSVDILPEFIALGTNIGLVYWYDRKKKDLQRLRCENSGATITCVKIVSTVDYMVACGNNLGNISIFQIPKSHPESVPENLRPKNKQVERYTVTDLHKSPVTAIEWSRNGMKLFSGDKCGCVVLTEIDFYMHICKSSEILNESYEIVQLSYSLQRLLVSTTYRSIICEKQEKWKVLQVGKKDRKVLGNFGGIICQNSYKASDVHLYCTRPGLRIWISDIEGNVQKTLLFKDLLCKECPEIPIINPVSNKLRQLKPQVEPSFGILLPFNEKLLVTYNKDVIYILDPHEMTILSTISQLRSVLCVSTHKDEIFILEGERSLIRVAFNPERFQSTSLFEAPMCLFPISSLKVITTKLQAPDIVTAIPPFFEHSVSTELNMDTNESSIMNGEEATESPIKTESTQKKFDEISKQEFEDKILYKKTKSRKKHSMCKSSISLSSNSSTDEKDLNYTRPTLMNLSTVGVLPDLRSPESIKSDIEHKEKILADILNLGKVKISNTQIFTNADRKGGDAIESSSDESYSQPPITSKKVKKVIKADKCDRQMDISKVKALLNGETCSILQSAIPDISSRQKENARVADIPGDWKVSNIRLNDSQDHTSDISLSDWEIL